MQTVYKIAKDPILMGGKLHGSPVEKNTPVTEAGLAGSAFTDAEKMELLTRANDLKHNFEGSILTGPETLIQANGAMGIAGVDFSQGGKGGSMNLALREYIRVLAIGRSSGQALAEAKELLRGFGVDQEVYQSLMERVADKRLEASNVVLKMLNKLANAQPEEPTLPAAVQQTSFLPSVFSSGGGLH